MIPEIQTSRRVGGHRYRDRREAGSVLGRELERRRIEDPIVVALPRGGVPVGFEVAQALHAPLDIGLVRKLGAPMQPELGVGALGEDGQAIVDAETVARLGISNEELSLVIEHERRELARRAAIYRPGRPPLDVRGRTVILVDDGLATGVTAVAAARVLKARGARAVALAVPVGPRSISGRLESEFDLIICLHSPELFLGVGGAYEDFSQTTDDEVVELLAKAHDSPTEGTMVEKEVQIPAWGGVMLAGSLRVPPEPQGLVVFAHGSGSSRLSPRNRAIASHLNAAGFATLLFDLLTDREAGDRANVFDIGLLANRLLAATRWVEETPEVRELPVGLFGASTGAAAALRAAALAGGRFAAVVSRGGRPDLAGAALTRVTAPTLLIVGGADRQVLELNREAARSLGGPSEIAIVPDAGHLFEEPGALEQVARLATDWFSGRLAAETPTSDPRSAAGRPVQAR